MRMMPGILGRFLGAIGVRFSETLATNDNNWANGLGRVVVPASALAGGWETCAVTFEAASTGPFSITAAYIGHAASAGSEDFGETPVQLLFSASGSVTVAAGSTRESDTASFAYDGDRDVVISFGVLNNSTSDQPKVLTSGSSCTGYFEANAASEAASLTVSGGATDAARNYAVKQIRAVS